MSGESDTTTCTCAGCTIRSLMTSQRSSQASSSMVTSPATVKVSPSTSGVTRTSARNTAGRRWLMTYKSYKEKADKLITKSFDPALQINQKTNIIAQAQVYATLALAEATKRDA